MDSFKSLYLHITKHQINTKRELNTIKYVYNCTKTLLKIFRKVLIQKYASVAKL